MTDTNPCTVERDLAYLMSRWDAEADEHERAYATRAIVGELAALAARDDVSDEALIDAIDAATEEIAALYDEDDRPRYVYRALHATTRAGIVAAWEAAR